MHENYPEMLEEFTYSDEGFLKSLINKCFFNVNHWKKYERKIISSVNHIIAVVDEMKEKIIAEYNYPSNCISVISNYEKIDFETGEKKDNFIFNPTVFYIAYVGGISPVRGLETVIEAVSLLKKEGKSVQFLIIGAGNERYVSNLKKAASHFKVDKEIHFLGYKKFNCINYYIKRVQLNIIPHIKNEHTDHTIPHKLFQIMLLRAPLIVSSCEPLIRYTKEYQAGNVFKAGNPENLAKTIISIQENPSLIQTQVENAYKLVKEKFNWESESEKLTTLIKSFYE
jgi:glycosyltransferase involved in cell wall biosynthesis